jgi:membrane-bound inhibitor of C-type lysozyme
MRLSGSRVGASLVSLVLLGSAIATDAAKAQANKVTYQCEEEKTFTAEYLPKKVHITLLPDGTKLTLPQVISGSGIRYSDGKTTLVSKGANATISNKDDKEEISFNCVEVAKPVQGLW